VLYESRFTYFTSITLIIRMSSRDRNVKVKTFNLICIHRTFDQTYLFIVLSLTTCNLCDRLIWQRRRVRSKVITAGETEVLAFTLVMLPYQASQNSFFIDVEQVSRLSIVCTCYQYTGFIGSLKSPWILSFQFAMNPEYSDSVAVANVVLFSVVSYVFIF